MNRRDRKEYWNTEHDNRTCGWWFRLDRRGNSGDTLDAAGDCYTLNPHNAYYWHNNMSMTEQPSLPTLEVKHASQDELHAGLDYIRKSPKDLGTVEMIIRRPATDKRESLVEGQLSLEEGLSGDTWKFRSSKSTPDGSANPEMQITIMNSRAAQAVACEKARWPLAGDQLYVDFDLSEDNAPPGTRLEIGKAILQISAPPHTGCAKFAARFGKAALAFVNSPEGKAMHLRGLNARVIQSGAVRVGDQVRKV